MDVYSELILDILGMISPFMGIVGMQYMLAMLATIP